MKLNGRSVGIPLMLFAFLLCVSAVVGVRVVSAYTPQKGDSFSYSDTVTVNNGQGSYTGYTDQTQSTGMEKVNSVSGSNVSTSYTYSYQFSNNQGSSTSGSTSGNFAWSSGNFTYLKGTDNQVGYAKPTYVWFAMNASLPVGSSFYALNTNMFIQSRNASFQLPTEGDRFVQAIEAVGTGQHQRNDVYGVFTASYTWTEYFDPTTGYIVGYIYVEQDNGSFNGQAGSFTYVDDLYATSTSYALAGASPVSTTTTNGTGSQSPFSDSVVLAALILALLIIVAAVYAATRRGKKNKLPKHSPPPSAPPAPSPAPQWKSSVNLGSAPPEQVVIRDVAKVNCRYCGTLIPTTVDRCPYCGGPRE